MGASVRLRHAKRALVAMVVVAVAVAVASAPRLPAAHANVPPGNPIKHVVVIYQENHSFDEVLGALCVHDVRCDGSLTATLANGTKYPLTKSADVVPTVNHDTLSQTTAINGGLMNGWEKIGGCAAASKYPCLTYYDPTQIPNLAALARAYALSDRTFQLSTVPSFGAHIELVATTLDGFTGVAPSAKAGFTAKNGWGCDSNKFAPWKDPTKPGSAVINVPACVPDYVDPLTLLTPDRSKVNGGAITTTPVAHVSTLMDTMDTAHLSWRLYTSSSASAPVRAYTWSICPMFADCLYTAQRNNMVAPNQILTDAAAGTLPSFAVLLPEGASGHTSQHNGTSMLAGDNWIGQTVSAIMSGKDWASTAIFVTYDDCGCFYDHVAPPAGLGIRNPVVIISPYARAGYTDSTVATTASLLAFTEHTFGLTPLGAADAGAYDYANAFNFSQIPLKAVKLTQTAIPPSTTAYLATHRVNTADPT